MAEADLPVIEYAKEMGLTHADFFRILPRAMHGYAYTLDGHTVHGRVGDGSVSILLGAQQERRIALLRIPYAKVSFRFNDVSEADAAAFQRHFDLYFQRGGG